MHTHIHTHTHTHKYIYIYIYTCRYIFIKEKSKVDGGQKAPFSIATKLRRRGWRYFFPWIAPLYP